VTATKKVLLAAAFVAAGYGVASLLGAPKPQILQRAAPLADSTPRHEVHVPASSPANSYSHVRARLVPDAQPTVATKFDSDSIVVEAPSGNESKTPFELAGVAAPSLAKGDAAASTSKLAFGARAKLRNEAPRPLITEPRGAATVKDVQPVAITAYSSTRDPAANDVLPAQFSNDGNAFGENTSLAEATAIIDAPDLEVAPAPLSHADNTDQPRGHIIVDGDSLAKLAGRYLDDPQRANEIYELNRHLLSHPDVLPIGAELVIPSPSVTSHPSGESPQSLVPRRPAFHAASRGGLVPVRPVPSGTAVMPRAQLARPVSAE
jgi:nucleoid-associated protein YgaU